MEREDWQPAKSPEREHWRIRYFYIQFKLIVEYSDTAPNRRLAVAHNIPGKSNTGREIILVTFIHGASESRKRSQRGHSVYHLDMIIRDSAVGFCGRSHILPAHSKVEREIAEHLIIVFDVSCGIGLAERLRAVILAGRIRAGEVLGFPCRKLVRLAN
jgi:hypothetical protein